MGIAEGIQAGIALNEAPLRQALLLQDLQDRAMKIQQAQRLRDALLAIQPQQTPAAPQAVTVPQPTPAVPPITQQFFGDPSSVEAQTRAFLGRYGPRNPGEGSLLPVGDTAATPTLRTPPAQAEGTVQAPIQPATPAQTAPAAPDSLQRTIVQQARALGLDPALALSLFETESNFDNSAVNPTSKAFSIAQFLPSTAKSRGLDVERLKSDPTYAAQEGLKYFAELLNDKGSTPPALWAYGGATRPETRKAYTDAIYSKYAGNLARVAQLGPTPAVAPAPGVQVASAEGPTLTDASGGTSDYERMQQFAQQYNPPAQVPMQMGPPPEATAQAPTAIQLPSSSSGDVEALRQMGEAHLRHGDARVGLLLLQTSKQQRDMQETGTFLRKLIADPGIDPQMRAQAMAGLGELLARSGQTEQAMKLLERSLPLSERELLSQVTGTTRDILLAQKQSGQPLNIRKALDEEATQKGAQATEVVTTEAGVFTVDKRTGLATPVTIGSGALGAETPTGTPPAAGTKGKPLPGKPMNESQAKAWNFGSRAYAANTILNQLEAKGEYGQGFVTNILQRLPETLGAAGGIVGIVVTKSPWGAAGGAGAGYGLGVALNDTIASYLRTEPEQLYAQGKADFIGAVLRKESGAAISKDEFIKEDRRYFPQPGDTPATIAQKRQARANALATLSTEAGRPLTLPKPPQPVQTPEQAGIVTVPGSDERVRVAP